MIDDPEKTHRLMAKLEAALPLEANFQQHVKSALSEQSPDIIAIPDRCSVTKLFYMGEEGGIVCGLDVGGPDTKTPLIVSITHLSFDRRSPLFRQIEAYQRHRVKKLKQQAGRGY
jgi:hypothetical protein